jgi:hypothetical protein
MAFSATDAAFEGFRIGRHKPRVMLAWAAASLLISLVSSIVIVLLFGDTLNEMMAMQGAANTDPAQTMAVLGRMGQLYLVLAPVALLVFSIFTSAVYRAVLRPTESAFAYLRLGATELRIAVVLLVLGILSFVAGFMLMMVVGIIAAITGVAAVGSGDGGMMATTFIIIAVAYVAMLAAMLAFWVKFSFAAPMTFAEGRIRIFGSWRATKGHFWPLLGCYVLSLVLGVVVSLLGSGIGMAAMAAFGGTGGAGDIVSLFRSMEADYTSLATFMTPAMIVNMIISSVFSALTYAIFLAPPAVAYRDLIARTGPGVADDFA